MIAHPLLLVKRVHNLSPVAHPLALAGDQREKQVKVESRSTVISVGQFELGFVR